MGEIILNYNNQFEAMRLMDKKLLIANWDVIFDLMLIDDEDGFDLTYVITKVNYFFDVLLHNSILFSADNEWASTSFSDCSNNIVLTPGEPTDDLLTILLYNKLHKLVGNSIDIGYLEIKSNHSGGLSFIYTGELNETLPDIDEWIGEKYYFDEPWWNRDDSSTFDSKPPKDADLSKPPEFAQKLDFLAEPVKNKEKAKVVKPEFKPKVVSGAKETPKK